MRRAGHGGRDARAPVRDFAPADDAQTPPADAECSSRWTGTLVQPSLRFNYRLSALRRSPSAASTTSVVTEGSGTGSS
jgi:hypothetical protein